jgi:hypothetical protein
MDIRSELFWDIDLRDFDYEKNKTLIIERVMNYGTVSEFRRILHHYGYETVRQEIKNAGSLEPKTLEFVSSYFNLPKESLRCYTKKQLNQAHWN